MEYLQQYIQYIRNTALVPLPVVYFDEDWEPVGNVVRRQLLDNGLIVEIGGGIMLTEKGKEF